MKPYLITALLSLPLAVAAAEPETFKVDGVLGAVHVGQAGQEFRVSLENAPTLCGSWTAAYVNAKDPNYNTFVQVLLQAKATKSPLTLLMRRDAEGYCNLIYVILK